MRTTDGIAAILRIAELHWGILQRGPSPDMPATMREIAIEAERALVGLRGAAVPERLRDDLRTIVRLTPVALGPAWPAEADADALTAATRRLFRDAAVFSQPQRRPPH